jgi:hypothetical protein
MLITLVKKYCKSKTVHLDGDPYLTRYYIFNTRFFGLYLHHFHRPDADRDLHNHPWLFAISYILRGNYVETKLSRGLEYVSHGRGSFNLISGSCFHRIALITPGLYTLFMRGPRVKKWGFLRANEDGEVYFEEFKE